MDLQQLQRIASQTLSHVAPFLRAARFGHAARLSAFISGGAAQPGGTKAHRKYTSGNGPRQIKLREPFALFEDCGSFFDLILKLLSSLDVLLVFDDASLLLRIVACAHLYGDLIASLVLRHSLVLVSEHPASDKLGPTDLIAIFLFLAEDKRFVQLLFLLFGRVTLLW